MAIFESEKSGTESTKSTIDLTTMKSLKDNKATKISIVGSGDFGRGLALRMVQCGYNVSIGSRNPTGNTK